MKNKFIKEQCVTIDVLIISEQLLPIEPNEDTILKYINDDKTLFAQKEKIYITTKRRGTIKGVILKDTNYEYTIKIDSHNYMTICTEEELLKYN